MRWFRRRPTPDPDPAPQAIVGASLRDGAPPWPNMVPDDRYDPVRVAVLDGDVLDGKRGDSRACAVAIAANRALAQLPPERRASWYEYSSGIGDWIRAFDQGWELGPFAFIMFPMRPGSDSESAAWEAVPMAVLPPRRIVSVPIPSCEPVCL